MKAATWARLQSTPESVESSSVEVPFKAQNMPNNTATALLPMGEEGEIGTATALQAEACGIPPLCRSLAKVWRQTQLRWGIVVLGPPLFYVPSKRPSWQCISLSPPPLFHISSEFTIGGGQW